MNAIRVTVEFVELGKDEEMKTTATFDSRTQEISVEGILWPRELGLLARIIKIARDPSRGCPRAEDKR